VSAAIVLLGLILLLGVGVLLDSGPRMVKFDVFSVSSQRICFTLKAVLKFGPDGELLAIYRARYPLRGWRDALELETLGLELERSYGIGLRAVGMSISPWGSCSSTSKGPTNPCTRRAKTHARDGWR
jgi:hypothetical protein